MRRPNKTWTNCVTEDKREKAVSAEMTHDRPELIKRICCVDPHMA